MIIDLCCGIGRFESKEEVISIDWDTRTRPTIVADIRHLPLKPKLKPRLVHASPPCKYFSFARARRYGYDEKGIADSLRLVAACFDAFEYLQAQTWTLENPVGMLKRILPTDMTTHYTAHDYPHKPTNFWSNNRALKRAIIPQDIRQKILSVASETK